MATAPSNPKNILTAAARATFKPLGLVQKGRSRTWLDDHGWWVGVVEFQPAGFSKGSSLNVGVSWLWNVKDHVSFDVGHRVLSFRPFNDELQFHDVADEMVRSAADAVNGYRRLFPNVSSVCGYYTENPPKGLWPNFNAAVACGLSGNTDRSERLFRSVFEHGDDNRDWVLAAQKNARTLSASVSEVEIFRGVIRARIQRARELLDLPPARIDFR